MPADLRTLRILLGARLRVVELANPRLPLLSLFPSFLFFSLLIISHSEHQILQVVEKSELKIFMSTLPLSECSQAEHLEMKREYPGFKFCPECTGQLPSFVETLLGEELIDLTNIPSSPPAPPARHSRGPAARD
jgi:hypothetical protein